ncbi:MAG: bifunctional oligoribonuclease/PAP phosphatase NrnA [Oscillospiraceae bacterium]|nr:bifunctional oligoribonuclease/PAP phosphatase NrnA [Oscillospiraceae bacterium]
MVDIKKVAEFLNEHDFYRILCHQNPDGDTIGSAFALKRMLEMLGKTANVCCSDAFPPQYDYMTRVENNPEADYNTLVTVDIADTSLFGKKYEDLKNSVDLNIDHHASNSNYANISFVDSSSAANCEIIYKLSLELGIKLDSYLADCIYTGLTTDTGCFRYASVTAYTHLAAMGAINAGAHHSEINRAMFETKSLARINTEQLVIGSLEMYFESRCAVMMLTREMLEKTGAKEDELEGTASLPREIEGVLVGALFREKPDGTIKVSVRTNAPIDASRLCLNFGGGGHKAAAGCSFSCDINEAKVKFLAEVEKILDERNFSNR